MFERLPPEFLKDVLQRCFPPEGLPLKEAARRWYTLQQTSRAAAAALPGLRVAVKAALPLPPAGLPWLHAHAAVLHLLPGSGDSDSGPDPDSDLETREECWRSVGEGKSPPALAELPNFSACLALQELCLVCPDVRSTYEAQPEFDTAPLAALPRLRSLVLENFSEFFLRGLPPALRVLRAVGASIMDVSGPTLQNLALPGGCRLDKVQIIYQGLDRPEEVDDGYITEEEAFTRWHVLRLPLWRMWHGCCQLETDVQYVCLGPPPTDDTRVKQTTNVRPILNTLLAGMSGASLLRRLSLNPESFLGLPSGEFIRAAALASARGRAQLRAPPAGRVLSVEEGESEDVLEVLSPPQQESGAHPRRARRVIVTSNAPPPSL